VFGISSSGKEAINHVVEGIFDRIALQFIGNLPRLKETKRLIISTQPNYGLPHLFVQAMSNRRPNEIEADFLKSLLESADGYIESLKNRTKSSVTERIDGLAREASVQNRKLTEDEVQVAINEEMKRAYSALLTIVEAESTKFRNLGTMVEISRMAASAGEEDPTVFFIIVKDGTACKECVRLHLMPDGVTPRLWKFSELGQAYHKRGNSHPSAFGLHPHCRCYLTYLTLGFGFDKMGKIKFEDEGFDAHAEQG